jgi:hypothetical protein
MLFKKTAVLHQSSKNRNDYVGACRFFNNDQVNYQNLSKPLIHQTAKAAAGKSLIVDQDTTEINYESHAGYLDRNDKDLGPVGNNKDLGFFLHPSIVIDEQSEMLLGVSDVYIWNRSYDKGDKYERDYAKQNIEDKESYRWITAAQRSKDVLKDASSILFVADREADIYEEFIEIPDERCDVLIRSRTNRQLYGTEDKLYEVLASAAEAGNVSLKVRSAKNRQARQTSLSIKYSKVRIAKPRTSTGREHLPAYVELYAIEIKESAATVPAGEEPICWILLTTRPVTNLSEALHLIKCYGLRWQIELVFGTLKSKGMDLEASELESGKALKSMAVMSLITALRINQLRLARNNTAIPASIVFTIPQIALLHFLIKTLEGKTERQKNLHPPETMAWAVWAIARLGGWKGYAKSESPPGNKTMRIGWNDFNRIYQGWNIANPKY